MPGDRERVHIYARELMVLKQIFRIAQMPPNVRIDHAAASHDELERYQQERPAWLEKKMRGAVGSIAALRTTWIFPTSTEQLFRDQESFPYPRLRYY